MIKRREPRPLIAADGVTVLPPITLADLERDLTEEDDYLRIKPGDMWSLYYAREDCIYHKDGLTASLRINFTAKPNLRVYTLLDADDIDRVKTVNWRILRRGKIQIRLRVIGKLPSGRHSQISRFIMGVTDPELHVHHVNGNTLDNRKSMLEVCTPEEHRRKHPRGFYHHLSESEKAYLHYIEKNS